MKIQSADIDFEVNDPAILKLMTAMVTKSVLSLKLLYSGNNPRDILGRQEIREAHLREFLAGIAQNLA